ncbi:DUF4241 domain-containing protein [Cryptosporangium arvum]|uniref:DUF4241 domain-containing protein n=1 Tax=Cryptosporangium arvum TaxID=80871 RepID=UPI001B80CE72|nr:DUF4241 domain-containing protein [Cryptosporangium arvum]
MSIARNTEIRTDLSWKPAVHTSLFRTLSQATNGRAITNNLFCRDELPDAVLVAVRAVGSRQRASCMGPFESDTARALIHGVLEQGRERMYRPDLGAVRTTGAQFVDGDLTMVVADEFVGTVTIPSGQIVGCDPLIGADESPPFTATVAPGRYALRAWVAAIHRGGGSADRRTAALELVISEQPTLRWELALVDGQDVDQLGEDGYFGYSVGAGVGTLADLVAVRALGEWEFDDLDEVYIPAQVPAAPGAIDAVTEEASGANVITVSSGWGDGIYPTYVGHARDGSVTSFVTDFLVVPA